MSAKTKAITEELMVWFTALAAKRAAASCELQVVLGRIHLLRCNCLIVIAKGELLWPTKTQVG